MGVFCLSPINSDIAPGFLEDCFKGLSRNKLSKETNHSRRREHREKKNREDFCVSFGIFFYLSVPNVSDECRDVDEECRDVDEECRDVDEEYRDVDEECRDVDEECRDVDEECRDVDEECRDVEGFLRNKLFNLVG
ncbi:MAG: hypothetical protein HWQ41_31050 [Nostoc sp. NOS(2021)]|uniref:hypothetical protein n=1 Tax=Nostoc sp. NOS(2021) TaxID=2815407 RepID=UPI0025D879D1|nr:hypothetical protein [Nostoc sp. NOS(2021)]MBN3899546.1 hypothetical protein [Nostoc sp. NOS(2021)]